MRDKILSGVRFNIRSYIFAIYTQFFSIICKIIKNELNN